MCIDFAATTSAVCGDWASSGCLLGRLDGTHLRSVGPTEFGELTEVVAWCEAVEEMGAIAGVACHAVS